ncbi:MAG TPA: sulfopyruvate decarboxylase subunit alpha [Bacillota bacterium]
MTAADSGGRNVLDALKQGGVDFVASLPDSWFHEVMVALDEEPGIIHVPVTREEEAVGIAAGAYLAGLRPAVLTQNAGLLNSCNALVTLNQLYQIPLLLLVSLRGDLGEASFYHMPLGRVTVPLLGSLGVQHWTARTPEDVRLLIPEAMTAALAARLPVAVLLTKSAVWGGGGGS